MITFLKKNILVILILFPFIMNGQNLNLYDSYAIGDTVEYTYNWDNPNILRVKFIKCDSAVDCEINEMYNIKNSILDKNLKYTVQEIDSKTITISFFIKEFCDNQTIEFSIKLKRKIKL